MEARIPSSEKGAVNGVAELDGSGKVPAAQLPSYVDDVLEYANFAALPGTGETGKIYVTLDDNKTWRWSGSIYVEVSPNDVNSVNGQTGVVSLDTDDISEGSTNLYYTEARVSANTDVAANTAKVSASGSIDTHSDVDTSTSPPLSGQVLEWDGSNWVPGVGGSGSGTGRPNLIGNSDAEIDTAGWQLYNDGGATPTDGTGGVPSGNLTFTRQNSQVGVGSWSFQLAKAGTSTQGEGLNFGDDIGENFDVPKAYRGKEFELSFSYTENGLLADGDFQVWLYDVTNSKLVAVLNDDDGFIQPVGTSFQWRTFMGRVQTDTNTATMRLIIHSASTSANPINLYFDDVLFTPVVSVPGFIAHGAKSFTPDFRFGGTAYGLGTGFSQGTYWREGQFMVGYAYFKLGTGASVPAGDLSLDLPDGRSIDTTVTQGVGSHSTFFGSWSLHDVTVDRKNGHIGMASATRLLFHAHYDQTGGAANVISSNLFASNTTISWNPDDEFECWFKVPISGWSTTALISTTENFNINDKAAYSANLTGSVPTVNTVTNYPTKLHDVNNNVTTGAGWKFTARKRAFYRIYAKYECTCTGAGTALITIRKNGGIIAYGSFPTNEATSTMMPEVYKEVELDVGDTIDSESYANTTGFSYVNNSATAFITISQIPDVKQWGTFGEYLAPLEIYGGPEGAFPAAASTWGDIGSITFSLPGKYVINAFYNARNTTGTVTADIEIGVTTSSGTSFPDIVAGLNYNIGTISTNDETAVVQVIEYTITVNASTTYYLKAKVSPSTAGTPVIRNYKMSARKVV